jgi:uncharacterized repeat protein (TIGR01451 family)/uncharacterized protein (TIGR03382 family)
MRLSKCAPRLLAVSAITCGLLGAAPAFAQNTTLTVFSFVPPDDISVGGTGDYTATINNANSGSTARGVTAAMTAPAGFNITAVSAECTASDPAAIPAAGAPVVTCTLADIVVGGTGTVTFTVSVPLPDGFPDNLGTCPTAPLGDATLAVAWTNAGTISRKASLDFGIADVPPAPQPGTPTPVDPYADLAIDVQGPATETVGQVVTYTSTVTNNGPCPAVNVLVDNSTAAAGLIFQSGTGVCTDTSDSCSLGTLAPGDTVTFTSTFKVDNLPANLQSTNNPYPVAVSSDTDDPNSDNDSSTARALTQGSSSGCSSGGPAGLATVALFLVTGLAVRRRRA